MLHACWGGLVRERGLATLDIFGNIVTSVSWFGVNMLEIGLHSYGFTSATANWLIAFVSSQVLIIFLGLLPQRWWRSFRNPGKAPLPANPPPIPPGPGKQQPASAGA